VYLIFLQTWQEKKLAQLIYLPDHVLFNASKRPELLKLVYKFISYFNSCQAKYPAVYPAFGLAVYPVHPLS
jgi:hypothetical protein